MVVLVFELGLCGTVPGSTLVVAVTCFRVTGFRSFSPRSQSHVPVTGRSQSQDVTNSLILPGFILPRAYRTGTTSYKNY